jgi:hypothetical protein
LSWVCSCWRGQKLGIKTLTSITWLWINSTWVFLFFFFFFFLSQHQTMAEQSWYRTLIINLNLDYIFKSHWYIEHCRKYGKLPKLSITWFLHLYTECNSSLPGRI